MLRYSANAPISWDAFMSSARGAVSASDYKLLEAVSTGSYEGISDPFLRKWADMNASVSEAVNAQRRQKLGRPSEGGAVFLGYGEEKISNAVINAKNPLEAEMLLLAYQYEWLETEKGYDPFTKAAMLAYALELRILIRKDLFTVEKGNGEYKRLFDIVQRDIRME